jgi:hypothetical protein
MTAPAAPSPEPGRCSDHARSRPTAGVSDITREVREGRAVIINHRAFWVGATYAAKRLRSPYQRRVFLGASTSQGRGFVDYRWPGSSADYRKPITGGGWERWAGEIMRDDA